MRTLKFLRVQPGEIVYYLEQPYKITHLLSLKFVLGKRLTDGHIEQLPIHMLRQAPASPVKDGKEEDSSNRGGRDIFDYSDADWAEGQRRFLLIRDLVDNPKRTREDVENIARSVNLHPATIYRWISEYLESGHVGALIPLPRGRKNGSMYITAEKEAIVQAVIEELYLKPKPSRPVKVIREIEKRCRQAKLTPPHSNTIRKRLQAIPESKRLQATGQVDEYRSKHKPRKGHLVATHPLELVQIDHTPADIELVDDTYRLPLGRPWITVAIDIFSRMVVGFYVSFERPSAVAAGMCVSMAMCTKEGYLAELGVPGEWLVWGRIGTLHADNAKEFRGEALKKACKKYGINPKFRPVKRPNYGGHIESLMDTLGTEIRDLPGAIIKKKGTGAVLTLREFEIQFAELIVNVYHERGHSGLGKKSPRSVWEAALMGDGSTPGTGVLRIPGDPQIVRLDFMPFKKRCISTSGVVIDYINYYSEVLDRWMGTVDPKTGKGQKYIFRWDYRDISKIYFYDPEAQIYYTIPYRDVTHPPMSLYELREVLKYLDLCGLKKKDIDERKIFEARERIQKRDEESARKTKSARRRVQRRLETKRAQKKPLLPGDTSQTSQASKSSDTPSDLGNIFNEPIVPFEDLEVG